MSHPIKQLETALQKSGLAFSANSKRNADNMMKIAADMEVQALAVLAQKAIKAGDLTRFKSILPQIPKCKLDLSSVGITGEMFGPPLKDSLPHMQFFLQEAMRCKNPAIVKSLLNDYTIFDVNKKDNDGINPIIRAIQQAITENLDNNEILDALLAKKPDLNSVNPKNGTTLLLLATNNKRHNITRKLITAKADVSDFTKLGFKIEDFLKKMDPEIFKNRFMQLYIKLRITTDLHKCNPENMADTKQQAELEHYVVKITRSLVEDLDVNEILNVGIPVPLSAQMPTFNTGELPIITDPRKIKLRSAIIYKINKVCKEADPSIIIADKDWLQLINKVKKSEATHPDREFKDILQSVIITMSPMMKKLQEMTDELATEVYGMSSNNPNEKTELSTSLDRAPIIKKLIQDALAQSPQTPELNTFIDKVFILFNKYTCSTFGDSIIFNGLGGGSTSFIPELMFLFPPDFFTLPSSLSLTRDNFTLAVNKIYKKYFEIGSEKLDDDAMNCIIGCTVEVEQSIKKTNEIIEAYRKQLGNQLEKHLEIKTSQESEQSIQQVREVVQVLKKSNEESMLFLDNFKLNIDALKLDKMTKSHKSNLTRLIELEKSILLLSQQKSMFMKEFAAHSKFIKGSAIITRAPLAEKDKSIVTPPINNSGVIHQPMDNTSVRNITAVDLNPIEMTIKAKSLIPEYEALLQSISDLHTNVVTLQGVMVRQRNFEIKLEKELRLNSENSELTKTEGLIEQRMAAEQSMLAAALKEEDAELEKEKAALKTQHKKENQVIAKPTMKDVKSSAENTLGKSKATEKAGSKSSEGGMVKKAPKHTIDSMMRIDQRINVHKYVKDLEFLMHSVLYAESSSDVLSLDDLVIIQYAMLGLSALLMEDVKKLDKVGVFPNQLARCFRNNIFHHQYDLFPIYGKQEIEKIWKKNDELKIMILAITSFLADDKLHNLCKGDKSRIQAAIAVPLFNEIIDYKPILLSDALKKNADLLENLKQRIEIEEGVVKKICAIKEAKKAGNDFFLDENILENALNFAYARLGVHASEYLAAAKVANNNPIRKERRKLLKLVEYIAVAKVLRHPSKANHVKKPITFTPAFASHKPQAVALTATPSTAVNVATASSASSANTSIVSSNRSQNQDRSGYKL